MSRKKIVLGILAHADAGKTTLSEAILYETGAIRKQGRVDHKDSFLDNNTIERDRGITVFSKEARFALGDTEFVLLDTPGHTDFSTEAERTLQIMDYAVLVISGTEGVQSHTVTLWRLLESYEVPVFVFINKMDRAHFSRKEIIRDLTEELGESFVEFRGEEIVSPEDAATCDETLMDKFLSHGCLNREDVTRAIQSRRLFPICFGAALRLDGVRELLKTVETFGTPPEYGNDFGAVVYKISRDRQGLRQTHMKITGGTLKSKMVLDENEGRGKAEQIRLYSGRNFESVSRVSSGDVCAVIGMAQTYAGQRLGAAKLSGEKKPVIEPALRYRLILPEGTDPVTALQKLRPLSEENPALNLTWKDNPGEIQVSVMGALELEVLQHEIRERFGMNVAFGEGSVIYKETITNEVEGIGHFEPLRHYAEVHVRLTPMPRGAGLIFESEVSEDCLDRNWQRLIMTHLKEKEHIGVLAGKPVTDIKITLTAGRAHLKHTEGGDFRQAVYRAVRNGLRKADSVLLEPMYAFKIQVTAENVGKALSDIQRMGGSSQLPQITASGMNLLEGEGPVSLFADYQREVAAYTSGRGKVALYFAGYGECHNSSEIINAAGYNPEGDLENPTGSIFCSHGSAVYVEWDKVEKEAHIRPEKNITGDYVPERMPGRGLSRAGNEELEEIFFRTYGRSKRDEALRRERISRGNRKPPEPEPEMPKGVRRRKEKGDKHFIIDGYNCVFAWPELKELATVNIDAAREAFMDIMQNYRSYKGMEMTVVFDGYKVKGSPGSHLDYEKIKVVYTREAQTADRFIEEAVFELGRTSDVTVVTSDRPVQMAALGDGAFRMSAREFRQEVLNTSEEIRQKLAGGKKEKNRPFEELLKTEE